jgi:RNA polymerase sigma factor (sigma-70 family)
MPTTPDPHRAPLGPTFGSGWGGSVSPDRRGRAFLDRANRPNPGPSSLDSQGPPVWNQGWDQEDRAIVVPLPDLDDSAYPDWDAAYLDNVGRLYRLMFAKVGNRPDAEDLTAEVFRAALGPLRLAASKGEVRAYLLATARTVLASHWRRRLGLEITRIDPDSDVAYFAVHDPNSESSQRASRLLAALPDRHRRVLELRFLEGCSIKEAALALSVSVSNAKVLQHRALRLAARVAEELDQ